MPLRGDLFVDPIAVQGQTFMVIGAAGELPKPPEKPIVFLEGTKFIRDPCHHLSILYVDMDDSELAEAVRLFPHHPV
jgi:ubiquitin carboxyl-terminal hydrolase 14